MRSQPSGGKQGGVLDHVITSASFLLKDFLILFQLFLLHDREA